MQTSARLLYPLRTHMPRPIGAALPRLWNQSGTSHLPPGLSLADFTAQLDQRDVDYVMLDFGVRQGDHIEVLVRGDADMDKLQDLVTEWPLGTPIRIYTVSPRHNTAYFSPLVPRVSAHRIAVFPPYVSEELLARAVVDDDGIKVLTPQDAFLGCAYRAAYMEAVCCDWSDAPGRCAICTAYQVQLVRLSTAAGMPLPDPVTPQSLDQLLHAHGWRPPLDLLDRAVTWAPWILEAFPELESDEESRQPGLAVMFLRDLAFRNGWKQRILTTLAEFGLELVLVRDLDDESRERAARMFRGGDWGAVNLKISGGPPACVIVAFDPHPKPVVGKVRASHPLSDNMNFITAKEMTRRLLKATMPKDEAYNPLHSTDNSHQAWTAIRLLLPEEEPKLQATVAGLRRSWAAEEAAAAARGMQHLTPYGSTVSAELVDWNGGKAVRKTFGPDALETMEHDLAVIGELGPTCPELPKLLERGDDFIVIEYVEGDVPDPGWPRPLPFWAIRQLSAFVKTCVAKGFDPVGLRPRDNVILTRSGIRVVGFDTWQRCDPATRPEKCRGLAGADDGDGDVRTGPFVYDPWPMQWFPSTALGLRSFLYDPPALQRIKQALHLAPRYTRWVAQDVGRRLGPLARGVGRRVLPKRARSVLRGAHGR